MNLVNAAFFPQPAPDTLYASGAFQARLWRILPGATPLSFPQENTLRGRCFLIEGELSISVESGTPFHLTPGKNLEINASAPIRLENLETRPATLLEIAETSECKNIPLPKVTENRPWGSFTVLADDARYKLKQLEVQPGARLSLQRHQHREEHWIALKGSPLVTLDDRDIPLVPGEYLHIPRTSWHRLSNPAKSGTDEFVEIIELQLGDYFGEDDIERRADDYGRA